MTDRVGRAAFQVCRSGRPVSEVAGELGCGWWTVMDAATTHGGQLLAADTDRTIGVEALGLDESLFGRQGPRHTKVWAAYFVHVGGPDRDKKLIEIIACRTAKVVSAWINTQSAVWRSSIK